MRRLVEARTGRRPEGPIRLLTHLRYFGYCMNPVSFYYCFDQAGDRLQAIVAELDHRMLLPTQHPLIRVTAGDREGEATFRDRRWVFPRGDCVLLPVPNTTSELLARYIAERLATEAAMSSASPPEIIRVEIDECFGNVAVCELVWAAE